VLPNCGHERVSDCLAPVPREAYVFESKELVTSVSPYWSGIEQELLEGRGRRRVGVLLRGRAACCRARGILYQAFSVSHCDAAPRVVLTAPGLKRPKNEVIASDPGWGVAAAATAEAGMSCGKQTSVRAQATAVKVVERDASAG
jgi:hypothetical protein